MTEHISVTMVDLTGEVTDALDANVAKTLTALGLQAAGYAQLELENDPRRIDTGLLRNSITYAVAGEEPEKHTYHADRGEGQGSYHGKMAKADGEKAVYVGTNVEYSPYVHEGHSTPSGGHVAPNRFLRNAIDRHKDEYKRMIEAGLRGEL